MALLEGNPPRSAKLRLKPFCLFPPHTTVIPTGGLLTACFSYPLSVPPLDYFLEGRDSASLAVWCVHVHATFMYLVFRKYMLKDWRGLCLHAWRKFSWKITSHKDAKMLLKYPPTDRPGFKLKGPRIWDGRKSWVSSSSNHREDGCMGLNRCKQTSPSIVF